MKKRLASFLARDAERAFVGLRSFLALSVLVLGFLQTWKFRHGITNDTIPYLDMGDEYLKGEVGRAQSGMWGPLYALVLGSILAILNPSLRAEYPVVHTVVFVIFGVSLLAFDSFARRLMTLSAESSDAEPKSPISGAAWLVTAYGLFTWTSLDLIGLNHTGPEMLVLLLVCVVASGLCAMRSDSGLERSSLFVGAATGLIYLTKPYLLTVSLVAIGIAIALGRARQGGPSRRLRLAGFVLVPFVFVALPNVVALSHAKGRFTFGEWGRYNRAIMVGGLPMKHWRGEEPETGVPVHPTRRLVLHPATYEYRSPLPGTYPAWYDASYWYEGANPRFSVSRGLRVAARSVGAMARTVVFGLNGVALLSFLFLASRRGFRRTASELSARWFLLVPGVYGLAIYTVVDHEVRYLAPFSLLIWMSALSSVRDPSARSSDDARTFAAALAVFVMALVPLGPDRIPRGLGSALELLHLRGAERDTPAEIAEGLQEMGFVPGNTVATVGYPNMSDVYWARLARLRIVGEVYYVKDWPETLANSFWDASPDEQARVLVAFARSGARAAISDEPPRGPLTDLWRPIDDTGTYVAMLDGLIGGADHRRIQW